MVLNLITQKPKPNPIILRSMEWALSLLGWTKKRRISGIGMGKEEAKKRKRGGAASPDWSSIPGDIVYVIADKIDFIEDYVMFCAVCRSWYISATDFYYRKKRFDLRSPFYMFGTKHPNPKLTFRSYTSNRNRNFVLHVPEAAGRRCWGSPFGWLVTFGLTDLQFCLLNPFTRDTIPLPSLSTLTERPGNDLMKAFLTADPASDDCLVLLLFFPGNTEEILAFAKPGRDKVWSRIPGKDNELTDIMYFNGKLYGVRGKSFCHTDLVLIQIQPCPQVVELATIKLARGSEGLGFPGWDLDIDIHLGFPGYNPNIHLRCNDYIIKKYLVELDGKLCLVFRYFIGTSTAYFKLFHINLSTMKLTRLWPMANYCLFIGNNYSFACKAASPPPEAFKQLQSPPSDTFKGSNISISSLKSVSPPHEILRQLQHPPDNLISSHVFYTCDDDCRYYFYPVREPLLADVGVWDMLRSHKVYSSADLPTRYPPLWFSPSISFRKLSEFGVQVKSSEMLSS